MTNVDPGGRNGYSYQGQDLFVLDALGHMRGGFFVDSGASNGVNGSNTRLLERSYGWTGICIEPNEAAFRELVHNRRCLCCCCCLYDRDGEVDFLEEAGVFGGVIQDYDPGHLQFTRRALGAAWPDGGPAPTVTKNARTLRSILREANAPALIDYWSLDTEGSEMRILRSFPFDEYRFRVLTVEHNGAPVREEIRQFLEARGYARARLLGIDDGYIWSGDSPLHTWRSAAWNRTRSRR